MNLTPIIPRSAFLCAVLAMPRIAASAQTPPSPQPSSTSAAPRVFLATCALCHGNDARGTDRAPSLADSAHFQSISDVGIAKIIRTGQNKMPAFPLPQDQIDLLVRFIRSLNGTAASSGATAAGDPKAGEALFFGAAQCSTCHVAEGRGISRGPDLSAVAQHMRASEMEQKLLDPASHSTSGYQPVTVTMNDGRTLRGFARAQGSHDLVLQTADGKLLPLLDSEYKSVTPAMPGAPHLAEMWETMPSFSATPDQLRDLLAFLATLDGPGVGPLVTPQTAPTQAQIDAVAHPAEGQWSNYNGTPGGNRFSPLDQINTNNVPTLQLAWTYPTAFNGLETTPLVVDGVMYVTANNQVFALSARTGREIWRYERPKSPGSAISGDAAIGVNRGCAILGDRIFYLTDNAHLIALDRLTGALHWDIDTAEGATGHFGGTSAPLVVGDLVITGVSGGDNGIRGFVAAYKAATGEKVWKFMTIPAPGDTGSVADTWYGSALLLGGGATWTTGSADPDAGIVYWSVGNPHPDTDGDQRAGSNLYTNSDLALDARTGKLLWYFQYTPHDLHDWDANQPIVLVDATWHGQPRKLLLHANRNGFLYVLDRTTGHPLAATRMVDTLTWARGIDPQSWLPQLLPANETTAAGALACPAVRGATNWYSTAWNPTTRLYYVMTVEDCTTYRKAADGGYGRYNDPAHPARKVLRAFDIETGKAVWQIDLPGQVQMNYSGVLSTAGGLVFFGESSGGFAAVDAATGNYLWHFETNHVSKASPMTYQVNGRQFLAVASGANIFAYALPKQ